MSDASTAVLFTAPPKVRLDQDPEGPSLLLHADGASIRFMMDGEGLFTVLDRIQTALFPLAEQSGRWEVYNPALDDWEAVSAPQALRFASEGRHVRHEEQRGVWQHLEGAA